MDTAPPLSLQAWIASVLARSITELNRTYWRTNQAATETEPFYHNRPSITTTLWYTEGVLTCCFCLPPGRFVDESG